jgi:hypothetical protein
VLAWQLEEAMKKDGVGKNEMAKRMHTSRSQLDRILDPDNDKVQLDTVFKAAQVLGREVKMELRRVDGVCCVRYVHRSSRGAADDNRLRECFSIFRDLSRSSGSFRRRAPRLLFSSALRSAYRACDCASERFGGLLTGCSWPTDAVLHAAPRTLTD